MADAGRETRVRDTWRAAWDHGDVDALDQLLDADYIRRTNGERRHLDRAGFKASILSTRRAFPDLRTTIDTVLVDGELMAIAWHSEGTHSGEMMGVPPTGRDVAVFGCNFVRFEHDRIVEESVTWDPRQLLSAIGIIALGVDT